MNIGGVFGSWAAVAVMGIIALCGGISPWALCGGVPVALIFTAWYLWDTRK